MRMPTAQGDRGIRTIIKVRVSQYSITRPSSSSSRAAMGEKLPGDNTTSHNADVWLFRPNELSLDTEYGDRLTGSLQGLSLPSEDIEVGDRITHQSISYEVSELVDVPDEDDPIYKMFSLEKRIND